ncbi:MAG TPA: preprotein translocase subunit SecY [Firmicutes bacterium]|uniref:preprotein translocase subunit SecY n=1 Tax=Gelria sp. Kuro-4 TaxID=2796927 RepID=UPI001983FD10|nr:preprotein translocase subunit SecY [Gelria sp. Kuro-4]BCV24297.1 protein translocase subunit SecY [Gelria sp. Kuro-4]HHV56871.1 preprotein translocase subunit SecY [Bacillota bacterium]
MLDALRNAWKIPDLRRRLTFTLLMFLVFRIGSHIPVPGIDPRVLQDVFNQGNLLGFLDLFSGGALKRVSIFALSVTPYITASIIIQLLTIVIPKLEELAKEGEEGRKKLAQYTRYSTVVLALIQAAGMVAWMRDAVTHPGWVSWSIIVVALTAGTAFLMWLGEEITDKGIGNGISLIIFAGIVSRLPAGLGKVIGYVQVRAINVLNILLLAVVVLAVIVAIIYMQEGERRITVQYAKRMVGRRVYGGQSTHIPLKVNQAGVIPIIFAMSVLLFPGTVAQFVHHPWAQAVANALQWGTTLNTVLYFGLNVFFTFFYTAVTFNPVDISKNMQKYGGFIPGIRPGRPTSDYISRVLYRITVAGALFIALVAVLPMFMGSLTGVQGLYFGGTGVLIVVGVALETMKQIEAHMLMRHYEGFLKKS